MEPRNPLMDDHVLALTGVERPRVCFLPTASGDADHYVVRFYRRFGAVNGPLAVQASKRILQEQGDWDEGEFWARQGEIAGPVLMSEDAREGATAFKEKRSPVWRGR